MAAHRALDPEEIAVAEVFDPRVVQGSHRRRRVAVLSDDGDRQPAVRQWRRAVRVIVLTRLARRFIPAQIQSFSLIGKRPPCGRDPEDRLPVFLCDRVLG
jgi:hypothetical protein